MTQAPQDLSKSRPILVTEMEAMGGAERSVLALSRWLWQRNLPNHFVTYRDGVNLASHADHPIAVVELKPVMRATKKIAALRKAFSAWKGGPPLLASGYQETLHATLAGQRGFHCLMHDTPSLFEDASLHSPRQRLARMVSNRIAAYGLRSGGHTIVTSEYLRDDCRKVFGVHADIARMGGLGDGFVFRPRPVSASLRMFTVSRLEPNKRIDWILRALATMEQAGLSSRVDWSLGIAGKGAQGNQLADLSAALGLTDRVRFLGYVSDAELEQLYAQAHLFLMPAVQGYGIPAIEALSRGLPVLLHRESGVSDILLETPWATVIDGGEESLRPGLEKAVESIIAGRQLQAALPPLPSEDSWAERVARLCNWL